MFVSGSAALSEVCDLVDETCCVIVRSCHLILPSARVLSSRMCVCQVRFIGVCVKLVRSNVRGVERG